MLALNSNQKTMSSLEIAKLTGKEHSKVMADIRRILDEAEIGHAEFGGTYFSEQNKQLSCYNLPRRECDLVVSGYSVPYRLAIIDRWQELELMTKENKDPNLPVIHDPVIAALVNTLQQLDTVKQEQSVQSLRIESLEAKQDAIINGSDYFAVSAYSNLVKIPVDNKLASSIGKEATTYCSVNNINLGEATHPLWGSVNTYPKYVLEIIFNRMA
jgi:phage regulator Rha-like protein